MKALVVTAFCFCCLPCRSDAAEMAKSCRIIYLERRADAPTEAYLFDGTISRKVSLPGMNFSEVIKLPEGALTVGMTPNPVPTPENFPSGAPTVKIPATLTDFYLVVVSDPENKVFAVRMLPLDVGGEQLKPGQTLWVNLTKHRIAGKLGNETLLVPAGDKVVGKAPLAASGYYKAQFLYQPEDQKEFMPVMQKSWWFDANSKNLGFIIQSGGRLPRIFTFRDQRDPEERPADGERPPSGGR
jgi:hypothetical protein